ncbi:hypothetical protein QQF64_026119, partial [Cirrhinus molitorella]
QDKTMAAVNPVHTTNPKKPSTTKSPQTKAQADSTTAVTPVHITNSQNHRETQPADISKDQVSSSPLVISVSVAAFAVVLLVVFCLIWRKRAGNKRGTGGSSEQTDDVIYANISSSWKKASKITH